GCTGHSIVGEGDAPAGVRHRPVEESRFGGREAVRQSGAKERGIRIEPLLRRGARWEKLANVAAELGATLIVVGAHGQRGRMGNSFVGSVATRLVATSTQSVLVVRAR